ncbi:MAG: 2-C-methyl-D-erythritol 4-phosphate cytidylyltransferase [Alicyclobacillaceae bacterium]|nr:2-C-methyl-D-erythritol 4-phosphate cytidylyltransferase [Alicyclobacillaceae bacterium]
MNRNGFHRIGVLVAAGSGSRIGFRKQHYPIRGLPMWIRSAQALDSVALDCLVVVAPEDEVQRMRAQALQHSWQTELDFVAGGTHRANSSRQGVERAISKFGDVDPATLLIAVHDAARPFTVSQDIEAVFIAASASGAAILAERCKDTVKWSVGSQVEKTLPRENLWLAQTPQCLRADLLLCAYDGEANPENMTDESMFLETIGHPVTLVSSSAYNGKITTPEDLRFAEYWAEQRFGGELKA